MLRVFFHQSGEICEYFHGGLTRGRFKAITENLIGNTENFYGKAEFYAGTCSFGKYILYCRIEADGSGKLVVYCDDKEIYTRQLKDVYGYMR